MKYVFIIIVLVLLISCNESKQITITDFSKPVYDTLVAKKKGGYTTAIFEISGYTNDTIKINFHVLERKYSGKFKYKSGPMDYYGGDVEFIFDPYKATEGKIEVKYGIY